MCASFYSDVEGTRYVQATENDIDHTFLIEIDPFHTICFYHHLQQVEHTLAS